MIAQKDNLQLFTFGWTLDDIKKHCEKCGRICYKSENSIKEDSYEKFIGNLIKSKHYSVLEHGTIYLKIEVFDSIDYSNEYEYKKYIHNPYSKVNKVSHFVDNHGLKPWDSDFVVGHTYAYITTNYRVILENNWEYDLKYICEPTEHHEKRITMWLSVDRGVGEEFLRHRPFSYSKESTRYCRYSLGKFGSQITTIIPEADFPEMIEGQYKYTDGSKDYIGVWDLSVEDTTTVDPIQTYERDSIEYLYLKPQLESEKSYMKLINKGWTAQQARRVLSLAIKGDFVMSGFLSDWQHVIDLRYHETTGPVHPDMKHIADKIYEILKDEGVK